MNLKVSSFGCCCALLFLGAGNLVEGTAKAQGDTRHTRAIELSETNNTEVLKRLNQLGDKKDEYKELEEEWSKPFESLAVEGQTGGALAPYYAPPSARAVPNKRVKELLERQKNWTLTPTDLISANGGQDWSGTSSLQADGQDKKSSSIKQFYDAMPDGGRAGSNNSTDEERSGDRRQSMFREELTTPEDPTLPAGVRDEARQLRKLLNEQAAGTDASGYARTEPRSTLSDFFGFGDHTQTRAEMEAQQTHTRDLQALYGIASGSSPGSLRMNALTPTYSSVTPVNAGGLPSATPAQPDTSFSTPGTPTSVWSPSATPDLNAPLHQWNPMYNPQELPKPTPVQPITAPVEFPRRKF
jgi:hypothetical protein